MFTVFPVYIDRVFTLYHFNLCGSRLRLNKDNGKVVVEKNLKVEAAVEEG